jgi:hypothetical protein
MMDLIGKWIALWMSEDDGRATLGVFAPPEPRQPAQPAEPWVFTGIVRGETPALGLWIQLEEVKGRGTSQLSSPDPASSATLVKWPFIAGAVFGETKAKIRSIGFTKP